MSVMSAALGPSRLDGCVCGTIGHDDAVAMFNRAVSMHVYDLSGTAQLFCAQLFCVQGCGDCQLRLVLVGALPLSCGPSTARGDLDLLPVYYRHTFVELYVPPRRPGEGGEGREGGWREDASEYAYGIWTRIWMDHVAVCGVPGMAQSPPLQPMGRK